MTHLALESVVFSDGVRRTLGDPRGGEGLGGIEKNGGNLFFLIGFVLFPPPTIILAIIKNINILLSDEGSELKQEFEAKQKRQKSLRGKIPFPQET